jgi:hypothetical protein
VSTLHYFLSLGKQPFHYDGRDKSEAFIQKFFFFKSISTYIETRFDNTVQCDPIIHFIAKFYRLYCLLVFFLIAKLNDGRDMNIMLK